MSRNMFPICMNSTANKPNIRLYPLLAKCWRTVMLAGLAAVIHSVAPHANASPLDHWHWRNPLPQGNTLKSIVFAAGRFVAVGDAGAVVTSIDGLNWTS